MLTLRKIREAEASLFEQIESQDGEITPQQEAQLAITAQDLKAKTASYVEFIRNLKSREEMIDAEIKRLQAMKKATAALKLRLETNLVWAVKTFGDIRTDYHQVSIRKGESVIIENQDEVPDRFKKIKMEVTVDKVALKDALKNGTVKATPGVYLKESETPRIS